MSTDHTIIVPGVCTGCGCTDEKACPGGCHWANEERTFCSQCAHRQEIAFLEVPIGGLAELETRTDLAVQALEECRELGIVQIDMDARIVLVLAAAGQVMMADAEFPDDLRSLLDCAAKQARAMFAARNCPHAVEVIDTGFSEPI